MTENLNVLNAQLLIAIDSQDIDGTAAVITKQIQNTPLTEKVILISFINVAGNLLKKDGIASDKIISFFEAVLNKLSISSDIIKVYNLKFKIANGIATEDDAKLLNDLDETVLTDYAQEILDMKLTMALGKEDIAALKDILAKMNNLSK